MTCHRSFARFRTSEYTGEDNAVFVADRSHCKLCWDSSNCYFVRWNCGRGSANGLTRAQNLPRRALASTRVFVWLEHIRLGIPASNNLRSHSFFLGIWSRNEIITRFSARHRLSPVCTENSVLINYVTEPPNVSGCHARISVKFRKLFSARAQGISKRANRFHMKRNRRERVRARTG